MAIYAVIKTGGKQYRVAPGDVVKVEKLGIASGGTVEISEVYLIADDHDITVGHPTIAIARGDHVYKAQARVPHPDAPRTKPARPARPSPTKPDLPKPSAAKFVEAPKKALPPKEIAPAQSQTPADRASVAVPDEPARAQPSSTTPEPVMAAPETITPMAPPASSTATAESETVKPHDAEADHARSVHTAREAEFLPPHAPAIPQPQAGQTRKYDKRWYWLVAVAVALLLGTGWVLFRDLGRRAPQDAVPAAAQPKEAPPPKAKKPVQEVKIKKPTAGAAPSAPVQPPD